MTINQKVSAMTAVLMGVLLAPLPVWSQPCKLVEMKVTGQTARAKNVSIDLGEASPPGPSSPVVYQGPPRIRVGSGATCTASSDVSLIEGKQWLARDKVYISTFSGSENVVFAVDARTCRTVWKSPVFEGESARYRNGALIMDKKRVRLDKACLPVR